MEWSQAMTIGDSQELTMVRNDLTLVVWYSTPILRVETYSMSMKSLRRQMQLTLMSTR